MIANKGTVSGKSFVIISSDIQFVNSLERLLLFAGAKLQVTNTGYKGITSVRNIRPDIIIFDNSIDDISATEVFKDLYSDELTKDIPTIFICNNLEIELHKKSLNNDKISYLPKENIDVLAVISEIQTLIEKNSIGMIDTIFDFSESDKNIYSSTAVLHLRLLVIEDDPLLRNLLSMRLQKAKIQHEFCNSGSLAESAIEKFKPTVIILDLMLPEKNGMDVLADMRSNPKTTTMPVIIFSNKDDDTNREKAKRLGVDDFLVKATTDLSKLLELVVRKGK
jgi:DNA-binding response OmpR family regulator